MADERQYEFVRYTFTDAEIQALGEELAEETEKLLALRSEKKATVADIAARWNAAEKRIEAISHKIKLRSEQREVEVFVFLETPRPGMKRIVRADNNDTVREVPMTVEEMQRSFGFQDRPDERTEPPTAG